MEELRDKQSVVLAAQDTGVFFPKNLTFDSICNSGSYQSLYFTKSSFTTTSESEHQISLSSCTFNSVFIPLLFVSFLFI